MTEMNRKEDNIFAVKRTKVGLGLFALQSIPPKTKLLEYVGKLLNRDEANRKGGKYLFDINGDLTIDGSQRSNIARYINHSCKPNAEAYIYGKQIWIRSYKAIKPEEEITIDYGEEYFDAYIKPKGCKCKKCAGGK